MPQFFEGLVALLVGVAVLFVFAWAARALLDARQLTWRRLFVAALAGFMLGSTASALLLVRDVEQAANLDYRQLYLVGLPFQIIATMGAVVVLEVLFSRPPRQGRRPMRIMSPLRWVKRGWGISGRALQVSRILARHGLTPILGLSRSRRETARSPEDLARRARMALEEAGGMFVKLGQLLATRPDLVPAEAQRELARLHSAASPVPRPDMQLMIEDQLGRPVEAVFAEFTWEPLGSASIGQAYEATLLDGSEVVVKVRRPGLPEVVERDLAIVRWLSRVVTRRTTWGRAFDAEGLAAEFADSLLAELDFRVEGRNLVEARRAAGSQPLVTVPQLYDELNTDGILVMERLRGQPLSRTTLGPDADRRKLADALCRSQVEAMMHGERFHGDPHPGNILILEDGTLGLIDLGISGRLDAFERSAVFQMLIALRLEHPTLLYESMVSIGAVDPARHDPDQIERSFARFMATYLGPDLPPPEALIDLMRLTHELGLRLPRSTMAMFRALATLTGTLEQIAPGYPVIEVVADIGGGELRRRLQPGSLSEMVEQEWTEMAPLLNRFPRHVDRIATLIEHGRLTGRLRLFSEPEDRQFVHRMLNLFVLSLLSVGTGVVSVMLLNTEDDLVFAELVGVGMYQVLGWIGLFIAVTLLFRVILAVLRSEAGMRRGPGR